MAKLYISSFLLVSIGLCFVLGYTSPGEAAESNGFGGPVTRQMADAAMELVNQLGNIGKSLASSGIPHAVHESVDEPTKAPLKLQHSLLLGLILWPLAILLLPVGCCVGCILCCVVGVVTVLVVGVLLIVGTVLYSGPLAGNLAAQEGAPAAIVMSIADSLASISNETLDALSTLINDGQHGQAESALDSLKQMANALGGVGSQLQEMITHPMLTDDMATLVLSAITNVCEHLSTLRAQTQILAVKLPLSAAHLNGTLNSLAEHVHDILVKLTLN